jgi:hypothetical protein
VQDVAAAILQAAQLPYVDPAHLSRWAQYRSHAGFADGDGELPVQGVFAFGPVDEIGGYGWPVKWGLISADEKRLRSPVYWLHAIKRPDVDHRGQQEPRQYQQS